MCCIAAPGVQKPAGTSAASRSRQIAHSEIIFEVPTRVANTMTVNPIAATYSENQRVPWKPPSTASCRERGLIVLMTTGTVITVLPSARMMAA
ncbi:hypothetical protein SAMN05216338_1001865 [Bradyrhizobium sp. Rc2d]|uniref:hypothetical protein n=1 Tax=Bradyrhizobium sp. Rc2d TaxID=1855321 RepID=UPI0008845BE1|nr:hypothetical protein [Bradyrhizobium sp. Rc2d]SDG60019.1 hypothetical protein SAMN05216338_1001865 [Bradyrhizobium sp. Rc2d]